MYCKIWIASLIAIKVERRSAGDGIQRMTIMHCANVIQLDIDKLKKSIMEVEWDGRSELYTDDTGI